MIVWGNKEQRSNITCAIWTFYSQRIWETNRTPLSQLNKSMPGSIDISIHLHANHLYACTFSISRKSDSLRRICSSVYEPFYCDSLAVVSFEWRKKEKRKKKQKTSKKGVSQSPLESSKLAGDNGIVNWGKSFPKASVRIVLEASGQIESDGRSLKNGLKPSRIKWRRRRIFSNLGYEFFH